MSLLVLFIVAIFVYSLVSGRLDRTVVTAPIVFTVLFMGWFGPRGLASIVLGLVYLEKAHGAAHLTVTLAVMATVLLSIFVHGLSAKQGIELYARSVAVLSKNAPENEV